MCWLVLKPTGKQTKIVSSDISWSLIIPKNEITVIKNDNLKVQMYVFKLGKPTFF